MPYTLAELVERVGGLIVGDASTVISSVASLDKASSGQLSFLVSSKHRASLKTTNASVVVLTEKHQTLTEIPCIVVDNPQLVFARIAKLFEPKVNVVLGIDGNASVDASSKISESASVAAQCVIGANTTIADHVCIGAGSVIGNNCSIDASSRIFPNVTILDNVVIGKNVIIYPGAVLGGDGFGFANEDGQWVKIPQLGKVIIGDDVEIGANTTIDRGALDDTIIGQGVKLDNQIQVAHNVEIGAHTAVAGCVGIAGSTRIGKYCTIAGGVGLSGHLNITDNVHITAMSLVTKSINEPGAYSSGTPLQVNAKWHRNYVRFMQLDDMAKRLKQIEKKLQD